MDSDTGQRPLGSDELPQARDAVPTRTAPAIPACIVHNPGDEAESGREGHGRCWASMSGRVQSCRQRIAKV